MVEKTTSLRDNVDFLEIVILETNANEVVKNTKKLIISMVIAMKYVDANQIATSDHEFVSVDLKAMEPLFYSLEIGRRVEIGRAHV